MSRFTRESTVWVTFFISLPFLVTACKEIPKPPSIPDPPNNFVEVYNEEILTIPEIERAWPAYRNAMASLTQSMAKNDDWISAIQENQSLINYLEENQQALDEIREVSRMEKLGFLLSDAPTAKDVKVFGFSPANPSENPMLMHVRLTPVVYLKQCALLLSEDAKFAFQNRQFQRFKENINANARIAAHLYEIKISIADFAAIEIFEETTDLFENIVSDTAKEINEQNLLWIESKLREFNQQIRPINFEFDRLVLPDFFDRSYISDGNGTVVFIDLDMQMEIPNIADRETIDHQIDTLWKLVDDDLAKPFFELKGFQALQKLNSLGKERKFRYLTAMFPDFHSSHVRLHILRSHISATQIGVAARRFQQKTGTWPTDVNQLEPEYLNQLPTDHLTGVKFRYDLKDELPRIISLGPDANTEKDQKARKLGRNVKLARYASKLAKGKAARQEDWVMFQFRQ